MANRLVGKNRLSNAEKEALKEKKMRIKDKFENNNLGDFQNLYPLKRGVCQRDDYLMDKYDHIYNRSREVFEAQQSGKALPQRTKKELFEQYKPSSEPLSKKDTKKKSSHDVS
eukprot:CAMPEP_0170510566 /NCGR_PEP_ID=MMETSP0208-20121228/65836_1 /TAXON_ID=197538 /ORGANISM="Strombidium inclinatum, Strain S3" /LENGTH=112 /DNA_ID=CAMNT_0010794041 /DNA_START=965 /DNA_END=1303 /DNA_ORIENTATION=+